MRTSANAAVIASGFSAASMVRLKADPTVDLVVVACGFSRTSAVGLEADAVVNGYDLCAS
jgi:hypothetical protein